ncbi:hypothetical protein WEH80_38190 [Actinomycetes bacterium KLBMP 9759]
MPGNGPPDGGARSRERGHGAVKMASTQQVLGVNTPFVHLTRTRTADDALDSARRIRRVEFPCGGCPMADLAYALLLIGGFALLVLMVRGLDSL